MAPQRIRDLLIRDLPEKASTLDAVLESFVDEVLPLCKNEASPRFLGFGDTGDDAAALAGGILALLTQQNLINQSFDSPSATFVEMQVLRWLRDLLGFTNPAASDVTTVWDVGGVVTHGGTASNTIAMMLAREHAAPDTTQHGVTDPGRFGVIVPRGIGHYSVKSALTWIGVGAQIIEVDTAGFRYDMSSLRRALRDHAGQIMAVVAYAGDSRTQTVEHLRAVHDVVHAADQGIWLHVDACWGLVCAFNERFRSMIDGIDLFDSVTVDPHKVMAVPYSLSALLVRRPAALRTISSYSDLIMQEDYAFGQVTPFIGTKGWMSLKLWMMIRAHGQTGLAEIAENRIERARRFATLVDDHPSLVRVHEPDLVAVAFMYLPEGTKLRRGNLSTTVVARINAVNQRIHSRMLAEGQWHLHQFSLPDDLGRLRPGATLYPLRFMANNPRTTEQDMTQVLTYVSRLGRDLESEAR
ncbi:pyridoxal phosphate-dependent decarboxylase family protein [Phytoactinopolyspora mesophila]|uniref:Pyridoxal-dependent decarboxylase n=1 Tax=Phytoactinopolyspora mesophila TaxID=2650750 RepID=A0A7K3MA73_9ACTN|nr:pyridoxal-dependent decarboxylase [Phytoactinopolyspora mesophila]NDL60194.1 pyridoxal-dependent decarboxylase [Phytoactinopolyspora mesophila]